MDSEEQTPAALKNQIVEIARPMYVQTPKSAAGINMTPATFAEFKAVLKSMNEGQIKRIEKYLGDYVPIANKGLKGIGSKSSFKGMTTVPLRFHHETGASIANSMYYRTEMTGEDGKPFVEVMAATLTMVNIRGRVIGVYCMGEETELAWTRATSKRWVDAILKANAAP